MHVNKWRESWRKKEDEKEHQMEDKMVKKERNCEKKRMTAE
jgi:hypothetical protein